MLSMPDALAALVVENRALSEANQKMDIRCQLIEAENDALRGSGVVPPGFLRMTGLEREMLAVLLARDIAPKAFLGSDKSRTVMVNSLRKKLRPLGISIVNVYSVGYSIPAPERARLSAVLRQLIHSPVVNGENSLDAVRAEKSGELSQA